MEWLKNQPKIDASRTGVIGHSEGGAIALILAAKQEPAFIVSLAGPGIDGDKLLELQREAIFGASGLPEEYIAESNRLNAKIVDIMMDTDDPAERKARLAALFAGTPAAGQEAQALAQYTPEIESFLRFKPADYYPAIRVPVLALNGEKDLQVIAAPNLEGIRAGITANGNTNVTVKAYPGLNHLFQPAETGLSTEYGEIEITLSPEVMQDIADWILAR